MRIVAVDIGGTAMKSGIWNGESIEQLKETATCASEGGTALMERVKKLIHSYQDFDAIGISTAGEVNTVDGSIFYANDNIPGYTGMPVKKILEEEFHVPVAVENDVNAAALGELRAGAGRGLRRFFVPDLWNRSGRKHCDRWKRLSGCILQCGKLWRHCDPSRTKRRNRQLTGML